MNTITIGAKTISNAGWDYAIIAEAGVNHENDPALARQHVTQSAAGGADAIKFQTYKAGKLACRQSPSYWDLNAEPCTSQFELFSKYDGLETADYEALRAQSRKEGIEFMSTAFDLESLDAIDPLVKTHKIASADLTNVPLLRAVASKGKPVLLSAGASDLGEIERAVTELDTYGATGIGLLHCVLNYPTPPANAYLQRITLLKQEWGDRCVIGYSDHTHPGQFCYPVVLAYLLGARIFEKHFTHDVTLPGNDHYHAMDQQRLAELVSHLDAARVLIGADLDESAFLAMQASAITNARRSIVAVGPIRAGDTFTPENLTTKRPGHGLNPLRWDEVQGKAAARDIPDDTMLQVSDVIGLSASA